MTRLTSPLALSVVAILAAVIAGASSAARAAEPITFEEHVRPILKAHCFHCHGEEEKREGNLDVRLARLLTQGGDSGPAIVAGKAAESLIVQRIAPEIGGPLDQSPRRRGG